MTVKCHECGALMLSSAEHDCPARARPIDAVCVRHQRHNCQSAQCHPERSLTEVVDHPRHYNESPSGVECIEIVRHMSFNVGSAVKYCWRLGLKGPTVEELKKAIWYLTDEVKRLEKLEKP